MRTWPAVADGTPAGGAMGVVNPATGACFTQAPSFTPAELDTIIARAGAAWPAWRSDPTARRAALAAAADAVESAEDALAELLTREQGKPLAESHAEVSRTAARLRYFSELVPETVRLAHGMRGVDSEVHWRSLGPVAAIVPWNFPVQLASAKIAPALAAGNPVVLKPSPHTPVATLLLGSVLSSVLPAGVVTVVTGPEPLGARLVRHPGIRRVTFTGSIPTGRMVAQDSASALKRAALELGGNDAAIILDDADMDGIGDALFWSAFRNCGQVCMAVKRVYAPARRYDDAVDALAQRAKEVMVGDGMDEATRIGPVSNLPQLEKVERLVDEALADGARAAGGRRLDGPGYFFAPTVLVDVPPDSPVVCQEQFGPVLPVLPYARLDEAVAAANSTEFGVGGSVWGTDLDRAQAVAEQLECGTAWINRHAELALDQPFTGAKNSGLGVVGGPWSLYDNLRPFVVHRPQP